MDAIKTEPDSYRELCPTSHSDNQHIDIEGKLEPVLDRSEAMDIKVEEVTDVKEEQEDPLAVTCPALDAEQEDGSEGMDMKVEEVTDVKEEEEDPLAIPITCPALDTELEDESETMDIKLDITDVKEEQEDPLAIPITCPALDVEQEVCAAVPGHTNSRESEVQSNLCTILHPATATKKMRLDDKATSEILVADTDSESGAEASDVEDEFDEFEEEEEEEVEQQQQASAQDESQAATSGRGLPTWGPPQGRNINIHPFVGPAKGVKSSEAPHINKASSPLAVLMLFFTEIFQLLVEQTNIYYQQNLDTQAGPSRRLPDITLPDIMTFIALALQMGHDLRDTLHDYWSRLSQLHTPFYGETMTRDRFLHILRFLHFADNSQRPDQGEQYDQLWKIRTIFDTLTRAYAKFYNPSEHLALGEVIVKFKGRVMFRQYTPKKRKSFSIKIYKLCDESGYTYDMRVYLGKDSCSAADDMTATHATVRHLTSRVEGLGHKLFMDSFFSSPRLFDDLDRHKINSCGTVWPNRKDMPPDFGPEKLGLKRGDIRARTRGSLTALVWKDRQEVYILTNMDPPPAEGNFCDEASRPVKPYIVARYNRHMGYVDSCDRMANSYSISRRNFKWTTKLFFHLLDLTVLNSWILLSSCGAKYTHRDFRLLLVRNLIEEAGRSQNRPTPSLVGRPSAATKNIVRLECRHSQHWPAKSSKLRCRLCSARGQRKTTSYKCAKCDVGLCVVPCFADYHTKTN